MKRTIVFALVSILVIMSLAACTTVPATITANPPQRTLNATGTGQIFLVPDVAYVYIGVRVEADQVSDALNNNNIQAQAVSDAVKALGVEAKDIQNTSFNVYPMSDYGLDGKITRKYYVVENTVYITVRDLGKLGQLLDTVVRSGANSINGITFDVFDKAKALADARDLAIADARAEALSIAKASGVTLGDLQSVSVYTNGGSTPIYDAKGGGGAMAAAQVPIAAGQLVITVDANLNYEIK
jgi:uncharacterized protein YggE